MKKGIVICCGILVLVFGISTFAFAGGSVAAIEAGADRLVELQRTDGIWTGTWDWYPGAGYNIINLTGMVAIGLLEAFQRTKDPAHLEAAEKSASFIMTRIGVGATGDPKFNFGWPATDLIFIYRLGVATANVGYISRALVEWEYIKKTYPDANSVDVVLRNSNNPNVFDFAFYMEAAYLVGDYEWAEEAAAIIANIEDDFYYGEGAYWYRLNISAAIRSLVYCGYSKQYQSEIVELINILFEMCDGDGIGGDIEETAYAIMALRSVGGAVHSYTNELGRWLEGQQETNGGWLKDDGKEYPKINSEALQALASTMNPEFTGDLHRLFKKP